MARSVYPDPMGGKIVRFSSQKFPRPSASDAKQPGILTDGRVDEQGFLERVRNYIPAEIVAFFIFVNSLVGSPVLGDNGKVLIEGYVALVAVALGVIACVVFTRSTAQREGNPVWVVTAAMSSVAFLIWVYAINAKALAVVGLTLVPSLSGLLLASFTLFSGFIVPGRR